jgi:hypothetical protein
LADNGTATVLAFIAARPSGYRNGEAVILRQLRSGRLAQAHAHLNTRARWRERGEPASGVARRAKAPEAKAPGPTFVWSRLCWAPFALPAEFCNGLHTPPSPENAPQSRAFLQGPNVPDPGEWEQRPTGTPAVRMHGVHRRDFYMVVTAELIAASPAHPGNALCGRKSIS